MEKQILIAMISYFIISKTPIINIYLGIFITIFSILYVINKDILYSLLLSMIVVSLVVASRYIKPSFVIAFITYVIASLLAFSLANKKTKNNTIVIHWSLYILLMYWVSSFMEYALHKYIMHCYIHIPWLDKISSENAVIRRAQDSCHGHRIHHLDVNSDMSLKGGDSHVDELFFHWKPFSITAIFVLILGYIMILILGLNITVSKHILCTMLIALIGGFVWNTIHPAMHNRNDLHVPLTLGIPRIPNDHMNSDNIYYANHDMHHQVKGMSKGNYNIVFLGADELLNNNNLSLQVK